MKKKGKGQKGIKSKTKNSIQSNCEDNKDKKRRKWKGQDKNTHRSEKEIRRSK